ncbi:Calcium-responsive transcription factor [Paramuricea clavata]|uniref:Calcium-responsive transcription factor n=1 Tax=Paramuricea clavata TaxID=317549 RepID=A0A6S7I6B7_PARCT|nr:Calcium-responsive transcription factor [Paramuricea clavata]
MESEYPQPIENILEDKLLYGYTSTLEDALDAVKQYELRTTTTFTIYKKTKAFGSSDIGKAPHRIHCEAKVGPHGVIPFDGVPFYVTRRFWKHDTKKLDCPAVIHMKEVVKFIDYKIPLDSKKSKRDTTSAAIKVDTEKGPLKFERQIYVMFPEPNEHTTHKLGQLGGIMQRLDEQLIQKINDLVGEGVRNVGEMKRHLKIYVKDDLFRGKKQPERNNRRYFPKPKTIKNHMYNATIKSRLSMMDQDNVQQLADKWREQHPNDKFYYRQYKEGSVESVPNSIDSDVEEGGEDNEDIVTKAKKQKERLLFIHQAEWQSRLLLQCKELLCDFHREQAWERWTSKKDNGVSHVRDIILAHMRQIARSRTEAMYTKALEALKKSKEWEDTPNFQKYFEKIWLKHKERWVWAYRKERLLVNVGTNNGLERQNGAFKHQYLQTLRKHSLSMMLRILIEEFLSDKHEGSESSEGAYNVFSSSPGDESIPSCECLDWQRNYLPCKHMLAVIMSADGWSWEDLPVEYQESPYLTLDKEVLFQNVNDMELPTLVQEQELCNSCNMPPRPNTGVEGAHNSCSMTETPCSNKDSMSAPTSTSEIPKKIYPKRTLVTRCCDLKAN